MATLKFNNVGIRALSACVPKKVSSNKDLRSLMSEEEVDKVIDSIGIVEKRIADKEVCTSDLCFKAAEKLLDDNNIDRSSIDALIFLSQTPDYKTPATAPILQHRLDLPKTTLCFDMNLACSGYVYSLSTAYAYASLSGINRVLLLVGDTLTKAVGTRDKVNTPLYGDAGTATLVEKGDYEPTYFALYSDGSGKDAIIVPAGGCRMPATTENLLEQEVEDGNIRSANQIYMDGMDVFNFALSVVPKSVKEVCGVAEVNLEEVNYLVMHQSNKFMTDFIAKRLKFPLKRVLYCLGKYGNTSSPSVPLTISSELSGKNLDGQKAIFAGFGAGLSWGAVLIEFGKCQVSAVIEY
jgi:3-oxoacyl-[acyl-carrier-protein] synthase-3